MSSGTVRILSLVLVVAGFLVSAGSIQAGASETAAAEAVQAWLALVDKGEFGQSWTDASAYFRGAVTREQWEQALTGSRKPLGRVLSREMTSADYQTSLPGAPDGEYVVILFKTSFENKKSAVETVTAIREKDGTWKPAGYFIR
jgi:hypothetical protein